MMAVALISCLWPWGRWFLGGIGGGGVAFWFLVVFIDSGPGTAGSWAPINWNMGQCLDLWVGEI